MKRFCLLALLGLFLCGCGAAAKQSEFWDHSTIYRSWSHLKFSWWGYKNPTVETGKKSLEEHWWGIPIKGPSK